MISRSADLNARPQVSMAQVLPEMKNYLGGVHLMMEVMKEEEMTKWGP